MCMFVKHLFYSPSEMNLANARRTKTEDTTDDDVPSTSGRQFGEATVSSSLHSNNLKVSGLNIGSFGLHVASVQLHFWCLPTTLVYFSIP